MKTWIKNLLPFFVFAIGFYGTALLIRRETFLVPSVVGLSVSEAVLVFSKPTAQLTPRILAEREDDTMPAGTVIAQTPQAGQRVKSQQRIYLTVSKSREKSVIPDFVGLSLIDSAARAAQKRIVLKSFTIDDLAPAGSVIAQNPLPGSLYTDAPVSLYVSSGVETTLRIVPDVTGINLDEVTRASAQQGIKVMVLDTPSALEGQQVVVAQRPLAGSIVDATNPVILQVQVG